MSIFDDDIGIDPDEYAEGLEEQRKLPLLVDLAAGFGGPAAISAGMKKFSSRLGGKALIANAIAGALYGGGKALYEGKEFGDVAKDTLMGAVEWPMYEAGGKLLFNVLKGAKAVGPKNALKFGSQKTMQELKPELEEVFKLPIKSDFAERRFGVRQFSDLFKTGREQLLESGVEAKKVLGTDLFMRPGQMDQVSRGAEELITDMGTAGPKVQKDVLRVLGNKLKKPFDMSL